MPPPRGIKQWCCLASVCDVCHVHPVGGRRVQPAGCVACIGWSDPAQPPWLKAATERLRCRPGRGHIMAAVHLQLVCSCSDQILHYDQTGWRVNFLWVQHTPNPRGKASRGPTVRVMDKLRARGHPFTLPEYNTVIHKKSFVVRSLYSFV